MISKQNEVKNISSILSAAGKLLPWLQQERDGSFNNYPFRSLEKREKLAEFRRLLKSLGVRDHWVNKLIERKITLDAMKDKVRKITHSNERIPKFAKVKATNLKLTRRLPGSFRG